MKLDPKDPLWDTLIKMTMDSSPYYTHAARTMLKKLRHQKRRKTDKQTDFSHAKAILLMNGSEVMAHNLIMKYRHEYHRILHAYTKNKYRKIGCQKRLLKYTSKKYNSLYFWTNNKAREKTFAYYRGTRTMDR